MQEIKQIEVALKKAIYLPTKLSQSTLPIWSARNTVIAYLINKLATRQFEQREIDQILKDTKTQKGLMRTYNEIIFSAVNGVSIIANSQLKPIEHKQH